TFPTWSLSSRGRAAASGVSSNFSTRSTVDGHFFATVSGCPQKSGHIAAFGPPDLDGTTGVSHRRPIGISKPPGATRDRRCRQSSRETIVAISPCRANEPHVGHPISQGFQNGFQKAE